MNKRNKSSFRYLSNHPQLSGSIIRLVVLVLMAFSIVAAQPAGIKPGDHVRVSAENIPYQVATGTIVNIYDSYLHVAMGTQNYDIPWNELYSLDVRREKRRMLQGALIGVAAGAALGGIIGLTSYEECVSDELFGCMMAPESAGETASIGALLGAIPGGLIGGIAGAATKRHSWEKVQMGISVNIYHPSDNIAGLTPGLNLYIQLDK